MARITLLPATDIINICVDCETPLVSGAVIRFEGQVTIFDRRNSGSPCYHCLYPQGEDQELNCTENGVLGPVAGMIATSHGD